MNELPSRYNPKETEDKWYRFWEEKELFSASADPAKKPFSIVIPPPNITGILHMGHALNNTIQDILIRYHRMKGEESLWMPGTDHAGIATQNVVEKAIVKEGLKRQDLGRDKFLERVWQWKEEYGSTIIQQLKKLGASCDWSRLRFTMDEGYSQAVVEVFVRLYEQGLIYQGNYIINWCPRCGTALSDEEAPHKELQGNLYYLRYPLKEKVTSLKSEVKSYVVVATTRPETMLGDTAVAVHPKDKRYKKLIGKTLTLPLVNRKIKIIADMMIDRKFGTGAVKVTPAHDPNDYVLGKKHRLEFVKVMHPDARMNENAGKYQGMDRFEARSAILADLKEKGLLEKVQPHTLSVGHCYRCQTIIEPYLSKQWFVKMKPLAKPAIAAVKKGKIKFYPRRWTKVYLNWMQNIQEWCISRQIWWGHRIPVYYCKECQETGILSAKRKTQNVKLTTGVIVSRNKPNNCPACGSADIYQDEDVLDTWFSSWLWPFATFGWPFEKSQKSDVTSQELDLEYFYPTSVLVTAPEIIFFWVARMIMAGIEFTGKIPFGDVYIHGTVRDIEGKKMSKSLGNIIDPLEVIKEYGADALRFSLISITSQGQDIFLSQEKFEQGRNFANKIWNASRFILMHLQPDNTRVDLCVFFEKEKLSFANRWILSRFYTVLKELNQDLESYKLNEAANLLYYFFWHEFCDWYLELIKPQIQERQNQVVCFKVWEKFLRILHPFMPFLSEEIWQRLPQSAESIESIMQQPWPHLQEQIIDHKLEKEAASFFEIIREIRNLRTALMIKPDQKVEIFLSVHQREKSDFMRENKDLIITLAHLEDLHFEGIAQRPARAVSAIAGGVDIYLPFSGILDVAKEELRIKEKMQALEKNIREKETRLKNREFLKKAPAEVILKEREGIAKLKGELKRLEKMLDELR